MATGLWVRLVQKRLARSLDHGTGKLVAQPAQHRLPSLLMPKSPANMLSMIFGLIAMGILLASSFRPTVPYVIGENLVLAEINLGFAQVKPITLFTYMFFLSYAFGLSSPISKQRFLKMSETKFDLVYVVSWFFVMLSGFEVMYNAVLWTAGLEVQGLQNPDIIVNWWPANPYAINVVFAAKLVILVFAISCFSVDYLRRMRTLRDRALDLTA